VPALASLLLPLLLLLASAATGCIVVAPGAQRTDWPDVVDVDAGCDSAGWWDLWAEVEHERGPRAVAAVWADVSYVSYDEWDDMILDYNGTVDLDYIASGEWGAELEPYNGIVDCDYPYEYYFEFVAEDEEGEQDSEGLVN
jgi:hypothetical protein